MMSMYSFEEKDWKLFRKLVPGWQEKYMEKLTKEYVSLLSENKLASEKFWALEERIRKDRNHPGVILEMKRSKMLENLVVLLKEKVIQIEDLDEFSDDVKEVIEIIRKPQK